jgi:hypothetical protein
MHAAICTLFEGHYHYGVAALANSLYHQGYRGAIYVGYRGELPDWSSTASLNTTLNWPGSSTLLVKKDLVLNFLPLDTAYHLTNYKPDFMLQLWATVADSAKALFYFDPDIVVTTPWSLFEEWIGCGVALCEDVNSPLAKYHPTRIAWRRYFKDRGFSLQFKEAIYVNGGFVGVAVSDKTFLYNWQAIQEAMAPAIGGLSHSSFTAETPLPFAPFGKTDQDALNATVEAWNGIVSFVGKEGMAFKSGKPLMSHALGKTKPWLWRPLKQLIAGSPPRVVDRDYWRSANGPIVSQPLSAVKWRRITIQLAAFVGRFYSRN